MTCRHCDDEAKQVQEAHIQWFAKFTTRKTRASLKNYASLVRDFEKEIEAVGDEQRTTGAGS
jgi:hypothetical protein